MTPTIFVLDDDIITVEAIKSMLEDYRVFGYTRVHSMSVDFAKYSPALIITDIDLGSDNGFSVARRLRDFGLERHVHILFISSNDHSDNEIFSVSNASFLSKSKIHDLKTVVDQLLLDSKKYKINLNL